MKTKTMRVTLLATLALLTLALLLMLSPMPVFAATCVWTGAVNTDWATTGNWSSCQGDGDAPPAAGDTVTIPNVTNKPIIASAVSVAGIVIDTGASLTIGSGGSLTLSGNLVNNGELKYSTGAGGVTFDGTTTLSGSGIFTFRSITINAGKTLNAGSTDITLDGTFSVSGTFNGDSGTVTFALAAVSSATVGGSGTTNFNHLTISASGKTLNVSSNRTISIAGNFSKTAGSFGCGGGTCTVRFTGSSASTITTFGNHPFNITIDSGKTVNTNSSFNASGNWTNDGTFTANAGTITFNGSSTQTIGGSGATTFNNLTINNSAGVTLNNNATVTGTLTLTSGDLNTGSHTLTLSSNATVTGTGDVVGNVRRAHAFNTGTNYAFNNANTLINFSSITNGASPSVVINLSKSAPAGLTTAVPRSYTITPTNISSYDATLRLGYLDSETGGMTEANLRAWRHNGTRWVLQPGGVDTGSNYVYASNVTAFSNWAITDNGAPTAVTLSSFDARADAPSALPLVGLGALAVIVLGGVLWRGRTKDERRTNE